jgi:hypothetical protein
MTNVKPGRAEVVRNYGSKLAKALEADPYLLAAQAPLPTRVLFDNDTRFMYQGIFDTDFDKYLEDAIALFIKSGVSTVFENFENVTGFKHGGDPGQDRRCSRWDQSYRFNLGHEVLKITPSHPLCRSRTPSACPA